MIYSYNGPLSASEAASGVFGRTISYGYDAGFRITNIAVNNANAIQCTYDKGGLLTQAGTIQFHRDAMTGWMRMTRTDGAKIYCDYNEYGELAAFEASHNGHLIDAEFIVYDNAGQIQSIDRMHGFTASSEEYGYDSILRLKTVVAGGDLIESYAHDIDGNRVSANEINTNL